MDYRILSAEFQHETNTFNIRTTGETAFRHRCLLFDDAAISARGGRNTELAGFADAARAYGWRLHHVLSALAGPGGRVEQAFYDRIAGELVAAAVRLRPDGILLGLHGAMVSEAIDDGEGELLRRLRAAIGERVPVAVTLDLHANVSPAMCRFADILVSYRTYPHVDMRETGRRAADILQQALTGQCRPRTLRVGCPMLEEVNGGRTDVGAMPIWLQAASQWEAREDVFAVSINAGFANADIGALGPTVLVTHADDRSAHHAFARDIAGEIWRHRFAVENEYLGVDAAAAIALAYDGRDGPLLIADYADNPGGGAYGDGTELLRALLDAGVKDACLGPLVDGESVARLSKYRPGDRVRLELGGKTDPAFGGAALELTVELVSLSDGRYRGGGAMIGGLERSFGPTAVVRAAGIEILVTTMAEQLLDRSQFTTFGIDPAAKRVVAVKSMQHFRADFEPICGRVIVCDSGALCTPAYRGLSYRHVPRPLFPLDPELDDPDLAMPRHE